MSKKKGEILIREAPEKFELEDSTIWSFPERGSWARENIEEIGPHIFPETLFYVIQRKMIGY